MLMAQGFSAPVPFLLVSLWVVQHSFSMCQKGYFTLTKSHSETFLPGIVSEWL
jgi:hypothetical protein